MKKTNFTILACLLISGLCAQTVPHWDTVFSGITKNLYCISFSNPQIGYIGGEDALLLKTTDSGNTWQPIPTTGLDTNNFNKDIIDLQFLDPQHGYAIINKFPSAQYQGKLFQTADGGQAWTPSNDTINIAASRCYFFEMGHGFLLGSAFFSGNVIGKMEQNLWTEYDYFSFSPQSFSYGIDFRDTLTGIIGGDGGYFHRTFDGGQTWDTIYSGYDSTIYSIQYLNDSTIIATTGHGNRSVIISHDSGHTWIDEVNSFTFAYPIMTSSTVSAGDSIITVGHTINEAIAQSGENGFAYWYEGNAWQEQIFYRALHDVTRQSASAAFAVGDSGLIITNKPQQPNSISGKNKIMDKIFIYPNPAKKNINLQYIGLHIQSLRLMDLSGRVIKTFPPKNTTLDISGLTFGVYYLKVNSKEGEIVKKVVILTN